MIQLKLLLRFLCPKCDNTSQIQYAKDATLGKRVAVLGTNEFKYENMGFYYTIPIIGDPLACVDKYTGCLKKLSFAELGICRFATNIISIHQMLNFAKLSFLRHPLFR